MQNEPLRLMKLRENASLFFERARASAMDTGLSHGYAVIPIVLGGSLKAVKITERLFEKGVNVQPIIYPAVEEKAARLRFFLSCHHDEKQILAAIEALREVGGYV
jgi:8-amino-7-oxononanoate synthase